MTRRIVIDEWRARGLSPKDEADAQRIAADLGPYRPDPHLLLGYLSSSIAHALVRPLGFGKRRLAIDLRAVDITRTFPSRPQS